MGRQRQSAVLQSLGVHLQAGEVELNIGTPGLMLPTPALDHLQM